MLLLTRGYGCHYSKMGFGGVCSLSVHCILYCSLFSELESIGIHRSTKSLEMYVRVVISYAVCRATWRFAWP
jgi:hypothetical protein